MHKGICSEVLDASNSFQFFLRIAHLKFMMLVNYLPWYYYGVLKLRN